MNQELFLVLVGAGVALASSLLTQALQHFLFLRVERKKMEWELEADTTKRASERIERERDALRASILRALEHPYTDLALRTTASQLARDSSNQVLEEQEIELLDLFLEKGDMAPEEVDALVKMLERKHRLRVRLLGQREHNGD